MAVPRLLSPRAGAMNLESAPPTEGQLQFVLATEEDFEEVLAISEGVYEGEDYLPSRYHTWLREPHRTVVLAKKKGAVIGLLSVCVVDAGETVLAEGMRVAPWERGKGVARALILFCTQLAQQKHPGVKVLRLTRMDQLGPRDFQKYRLITKQGMLQLRFDGPQLLARLRAGGLRPSPVEALNAAEVRRLVLSPTFQSEVLPAGTLLQDWQPYRPRESNLALLAPRRVRWLADCKVRPTAVSLCGPPFPIPLGAGWARLAIDAFGRRAAPLQAQLVRHLRERLPALGGVVVCQLFLRPGLWPELAEFCRAGLGLEPAKGYAEQALLEADL
ncbi:putative N-acetyltransferase 16 [Carettochelys insculpta]|uniref:putative N-acetyltransferase 16 n=1 Tax=Carettochelys insculpta TaxID=44489 RepID=UPI003EBA7D2F